MSTSSAARGPGRLAAEGRLGDRPIARLLVEIFGKRVTGTLVVEDGSGARTEVRLANGAPVEVHEQGAPAPDVRAALLRLYGVRQGRFALHVDGVPPPPGTAPVDPRVIVFPGLRARYDEHRLGAELAPLAPFTFRLVPVPPQALAALGFPPGDPVVEALRMGELTLEAAEKRAPRAHALAVVLALLYTDLLQTTPRAAAQNAPAPSTGAPDLRATITALAARLPGLSHEELLGVAKGAPPAEVNAAYLRAARQFHPDRLAGAGLRDLAPAAERIMARLADASAALSDPKRAAEIGAAPAAPNPAQAIVAGERAFQQGDTALRKGDFAAAAVSFAEAVRLDPSEPQHRAYLAFTRYADPRASDKDRLGREALKVLEEAVKQQPRFARGHLFIGRIRKDLGEPERAARAFRDALGEDPSLFEAERELRLLAMRKQQSAKEHAPGGVLGRLFKK